MSVLSFKNEYASPLQINDLEKEGALSSLGPCVASLLILWCLTHFLSSQEAQMKSKSVAAGDSSPWSGGGMVLIRNVPAYILRSVKVTSLADASPH